MSKAYLSSTFQDLQECRAAAQLALRRLGVDVVAMETFAAKQGRVLPVILAQVADSDIYLGIFAWQYGYIPEGYDRSVTELEYRTALEHGKRCLIFLLSEDAPWPARLIDRGPGAGQIEALRAELMQRHVCAFFTDPEDLAALVTALGIILGGALTL